MTTTARKRESDAPKSRHGRRRGPHGTKELGPFVCDPLPDEEAVDLKKVIDNQQMLVFQRHLEKWVKENATDDEGNQWSQHEIGEKLGVAQTIVGSWKKGDARPGIVTLIRLRRKFGISIDAMLGLPPVRVR